MLKLNFKINKEYLAAHAIDMVAWNESPFPEWEKIVLKMQKKYPCAKPFSYGISSLAIGGFNVCHEFEDLTKKILITKEFQKLYNETEEYLKFVENQWDKNKKEALKILKNTTRLKLPSKTIDVFITHPKLRNGRALFDYNSILWGHPEDFPNYSTVYLCHELLHIIIPRNLQNKYYPEIHALIELATDNELRIRLNKKGKYFDIPTHQELLPLAKKLHYKWKEYLKDKKGLTIIDLAKILKTAKD